MTETKTCRNCDHAMPHNLWGRCAEEGCECRSYEPTDGDARVIVLRNPETLRPVAVPGEIVKEVDRVYRAYTSWRDGKPYELIALEDDWPNARSVAEAVKGYLDEGRAVLRGHSAREAISADLDALRQLQAAFTPGALAGKVQHAQLVRQVIRDKLELYQLLPALPDGADGDVIDGVVENPRTLVVGGGGDYAGELKALAPPQP